MSESELNNCCVQNLDPDLDRWTYFQIIQNIIYMLFSFCEKNKVVFLLFLVQTNVLYGVIRIEETKLVCAISRKIMFGWKT